MTSVPGIFAGGDCVFGPRLIIDSVADGKRAAAGIDEFLRGTKPADPELEVEILDRHQMITNYMEIARQSVPMLPLERRTGMTEVEVGFDEETRCRKRNAACVAGSTRYSKARQWMAPNAFSVADAWMFVLNSAWNWCLCRNLNFRSR